MRDTKLQELMMEAFDARSRLMFKKGADYADEDILSNFKRVAATAKLMRIDVSEPDGVVTFMLLHKLDRLCNMLVQARRTGSLTHQAESVADTLLDMQNYMDLLHALLVDGYGNGTE